MKFNEFNRAKSELSIQEDIRDGKTRISGPVAYSLESILKESVDCINELKSTTEGQVNEEAIKQLADELKIDDKELIKNFNEGLSYNIKAAYKLGLLNEHSSPEDIKYIIGAYTLSFRSALSNFKKFNKEEPSNNILNIAKKMYLLPSNVLQELKNKFKNNELADDRMIKRFAIGNPTNPEAAIEKALKVINELKEKYKDNELVEDWMIKHHAIGNPTNPEAAIEKALKVINELKEKYKDNELIEDWMIKNFAINYPTNPEAAIEKALKVINELKEKYKDNELVEDWIIKRFAINNPTNPEAAIEKALNIINELKEKYKDNELVDDSMIKHFAIDNPTNPEAAIENKLKEKS
ncbi:MAG: hypothetical protein JJE53_03610 [Candidatus Pacebacteria bacterium]|nr:hypothetical protein [Candidatus Paceibacterota bacterium]